MISAWVPDEYFLSETDKLNFYREIEMITDRDDLEYLKNSFFENSTNSEIPEQTEHLFELLECQIYCKEYMIENIRRIWVNYQLSFDKRADIETLKGFLKLDNEVKFSVIDAHKIRTPIKGFANDGIFIKYVLRLFSGKIWNPKMRLARK
jgi:transcription-repair coupling factor (superfamily II helicase)